MNWQPIETAPRDGTEILLFQAIQYGVMMRVGNWDERGEHIDTGKRVAGWTEADDGYIGCIEPTHWMPLPEPPTQGDAA